MRKLLIAFTSCSLIACPADEPPQDGPDSGHTERDQGSSDPDMTSRPKLSLLDVDPASGPVEGGTTVTLHGEAFRVPMTVRFGNTTAVEAVVVSKTEATAVTPPSPVAGVVSVVVSTGDDTAAFLNSFSYTGEPPLDAEIERCHLQFPNLIEAATPGEPIEFYGRVKVDGITGGQQHHDALRGQLFLGPVGEDPRTNEASFTFIDAGLSNDPIALGEGENEYTATTSPAAGEYAFGFRFTVGGEWTYCGLWGGDFALDSLGALNVGDIDAIDFCHVWQDTLEDDADATSQPLVTVEVYEDPTTVDNGGANSDAIEAQAAAIPPGVNPAFATVTWNALPYKDVRAGVPNNYEYEGTPYTEATHPPAGTYNVVARVRHANDGAWTYCDIDETADAFRLEAAAVLTIH